jgi:hypothetical protein
VRQLVVSGSMGKQKNQRNGCKIGLVFSEGQGGSTHLGERGGRGVGWFMVE